MWEIIEVHRVLLFGHLLFRSTAKRNTLQLCFRLSKQDRFYALAVQLHPRISGEPFMLGPTDRTVRPGEEHRHGAKPRWIHFVLGVNTMPRFRAPDHEYSHYSLHPFYVAP